MKKIGFVLGGVIFITALFLLLFFQTPFLKGEEKIFLDHLPISIYEEKDINGELAPDISDIQISPPGPIIKYSFLTGEELAVDIDEKVIGVMIDNIPNARPGHLNVNQSKIVFEAMAEGGIMRFLALFSTVDLPPYLGPIRSARDYFMDFQKPFGGVYIHAGGSDRAMEELVNENHFIDLDHGSFGEEDPLIPFFRNKSIPAPHNLFLAVEKITDEIEVSPSLDNAFWSFTLDDVTLESDIQVKSVSLYPNLWVASSSWKYNGEQYIRSAPQAPEYTTDNLVVMEMDHYLIPNDPKLRITIETIGQGTAWIFRNGYMQMGLWKKSSRDGAFSFYDEAGNEIFLKAGKTWLTIIRNRDDIEVKEFPKEETITVQNLE